jgi:hypothetical protein
LKVNETSVHGVVKRTRDLDCVCHPRVEGLEAWNLCHAAGQLEALNKKAWESLEGFEEH